MENTIRNIMCPFCKSLQSFIGMNKKKKLLACGHTLSFKKTRSQKEMDRKYIRTPDGGLELIK